MIGGIGNLFDIIEESVRKFHDKFTLVIVSDKYATEPMMYNCTADNYFDGK